MLEAIRKKSTTKARMNTHEVRENLAALPAGRGEKILIAAADPARGHMIQTGQVAERRAYRRVRPRRCDRP